MLMLVSLRHQENCVRYLGLNKYRYGEQSKQITNDDPKHTLSSIADGRNQN